MSGLALVVKQARLLHRRKPGISEILNGLFTILGLQGKVTFRPQRGSALHVAGPFRGRETSRPLPCLRGPGRLQTEEMSKQD